MVLELALADLLLQCQLLLVAPRHIIEELGRRVERQILYRLGDHVLRLQRDRRHLERAHGLVKRVHLNLVRLVLRVEQVAQLGAHDLHLLLLVHGHLGRLLVDVAVKSTIVLRREAARATRVKVLLAQVQLGLFQIRRIGCCFLEGVVSDPPVLLDALAMVAVIYVGHLGAESFRGLLRLRGSRRGQLPRVGPRLLLRIKREVKALRLLTRLGKAVPRGCLPRCDSIRSIRRHNRLLAFFGGRALVAIQAEAHIVTRGQWLQFLTILRPLIMVEVLEDSHLVVLALDQTRCFQRAVVAALRGDLGRGDAADGLRHDALLLRRILRLFL